MIASGGIEIVIEDLVLVVKMLIGRLYFVRWNPLLRVIFIIRFEK